MRDRLLVCSSCGVRFVWTAWEQRHDEREPELCPGCRALDLFTTEHVGRVRHYNPKRGWGFIRMDSGKDVFVHRSALRAPLRSLRPGQRVRFRVTVDDRGLRAVAVRLHRRSRGERSDGEREAGGLPPDTGGGQVTP